VEGLLLNHRHRNNNGMRNFLSEQKSVKNELQLKQLQHIQKNLVLWNDIRYNGWINEKYDGGEHR
jgi:hypothetical protein